jgi:hypothetical protein
MMDIMTLVVPPSQPGEFCCRCAAGLVQSGAGMGMAWMTEGRDVVRPAGDALRGSRLRGPMPWKQPVGRHAAPRSSWSLLADLRRAQRQPTTLIASRSRSQASDVPDLS